ncbi:MAG: hypothetical protein JXA43_01405 [Candidatus Diapherotrites archaeon]|nr:hypothetical protein [Candidatus Diapherotrites archaeon]
MMESISGANSSGGGLEISPKLYEELIESTIQSPLPLIMDQLNHEIADVVSSINPEDLNSIDVSHVFNEISRLEEKIEKIKDEAFRVNLVKTDDFEIKIKAYESDMAKITDGIEALYDAAIAELVGDEENPVDEGLLGTLDAETSTIQEIDKAEDLINLVIKVNQVLADKNQGTENEEIIKNRLNEAWDVRKTIDVIKAEKIGSFENGEIELSKELVEAVSEVVSQEQVDAANKAAGYLETRQKSLIQGFSLLEKGLTADEFAKQVSGICESIKEQKDVLRNSADGKEYIRWAEELSEIDPDEMVKLISEKDKETLGLIGIELPEEIDLEAELEKSQEEKKPGFFRRLFGGKKEEKPEVEELPEELTVLSENEISKLLDENGIGGSFIREIVCLSDISAWRSTFAKRGSDGYNELSELRKRYLSIVELENTLAEKGKKFDESTEITLKRATKEIEKAAAKTIWMRIGSGIPVSKEQEKYADKIGAKHNLSKGDWVSTRKPEIPEEMPVDIEVKPKQTTDEINKTYPKYKRGIADRAKFAQIKHATELNEIPKDKVVCPGCGFVVKDTGSCAVCRTKLE